MGVGPFPRRWFPHHAGDSACQPLAPWAGTGHPGCGYNIVEGVRRTDQWLTRGRPKGNWLPPAFELDDFGVFARLGKKPKVLAQIARYAKARRVWERVRWIFRLRSDCRIRGLVIAASRHIANGKNGREAGTLANARASRWQRPSLSSLAWATLLPKDFRISQSCADAGEVGAMLFRRLKHPRCSKRPYVGIGLRGAGTNC
jgi:hypothetical protein